MIETAAVPQSTREERTQVRKETLALLLKRPTFVAGTVVFGAWLVCTFVGEGLAPYDPFNDYFAGHRPPDAEHWLGTDRLGRDVLSRVIVGARDLLVVSSVAAVLAVGAGTLVGLVMGYFRGLLDDALGRLVDAFLSLPSILLALLALVVFGPSTPVIVGVVSLIYAFPVARTIRAAVMAERQLDYIVAARLRGETATFIMAMEILPNVASVVAVEMTVRFAYSIFTIATLSFLGVGLQSPSPDWGLTVSQEYSAMIGGIWWTTLFPALAIASAVVSVNLIADSLQAVLSE